MSITGNIKGTYGDPALAIKLANVRIPFGKHANTLLLDLPMTYLDWFDQQGWPQGELGRLMRIIHEIRLGGMEHLFDGIRDAPSKDGSNRSGH
jgi:uncharacterized protein (DUF3820 family)